MGKSPSDPTGATFLHEAVRLGNPTWAEALLAGGADINATDHTGWTPLHWAVSRGNREMVELLLAKGANAFAATRLGATARQLAIQSDLPEIQSLLPQIDGTAEFVDKPKPAEPATYQSDDDQLPNDTLACLLSKVLLGLGLLMAGIAIALFLYAASLTTTILVVGPGVPAMMFLGFLAYWAAFGLFLAGAVLGRFLRARYGLRFRWERAPHVLALTLAGLAVGFTVFTLSRTEPVLGQTGFWRLWGLLGPQAFQTTPSAIVPFALAILLSSVGLLVTAVKRFWTSALLNLVALLLSLWAWKAAWGPEKGMTLLVLLTGGGS